MVASQCKLSTCSRMNTEYRSHDGSQSVYVEYLFMDEQ